MHFFWLVTSHVCSHMAFTPYLLLKRMSTICCRAGALPPSRASLEICHPNRCEIRLEQCTLRLESNLSLLTSPVLLNEKDLSGLHSYMEICQKWRFSLFVTLSAVCDVSVLSEYIIMRRQLTNYTSVSAAGRGEKTGREIGNARAGERARRACLCK